MQNRDFIKLAKDEYRKIGYVECPAFSGEKVYFTNKGFLHLLRKGLKLREIYEQQRRLLLIEFAPSIIKDSISYTKYSKKAEGGKPVAHFWSFVEWRDNKKITVIVRQIESKRKHFFSIF